TGQTDIVVPFFERLLIYGWPVSSDAVGARAASRSREREPQIGHRRQGTAPALASKAQDLKGSKVSPHRSAPLLLRPRALVGGLPQPTRSIRLCPRVLSLEHAPWRNPTSLYPLRSDSAAPLKNSSLRFRRRCRSRHPVSPRTARPTSPPRWRWQKRL